MGSKAVKKALGLVALALVVIGQSALPASVVILKNGDIISGRLEDKGTSYRLQSNFGQLEIQKNNIEKVIWDEASLQKVEVTVEQKRMTGRLIRTTRTEKAYLLGDGRVIRRSMPSPKLPSVFHRPQFILSPLVGARALQRLYFTSSGQPAMDRSPSLNSAGAIAGLVWPVQPQVHFHFEGGYSYAHSGNLASTQSSAQVQSATTTHRWSGGVAVRIYPFRFGSIGQTASLWNRWYVGAQGGYHWTQGKIHVASIDPYYFMDGRTVHGDAHSLYTGASSGMVLPLNQSLTLDFGLRWEIDFIQTLFSQATRRSVTGPERELDVTGDGPLATQLRSAAARESANKDKMTNAFRSSAGYVQTWTVQLGLSYNFPP